jgi:quercetin dioxygenase-like cupin family protein
VFALAGEIARAPGGLEAFDAPRAGTIQGMSARIERADRPLDRAEIEARFEREGLRAHAWGNGPGERYGWHAHGYRKVLYCVRGSIVFHTRGGDLQLRAGDRLEVDPGIEHAATVGGDGVLCLEAAG